MARAPVCSLILLQALGCSGRLLKIRSAGSDALAGDGATAAAPAAAGQASSLVKADLSDKDCTTFSKAFMVVPQPTCLFSKYDGGWAGCSCDVPLPPQVRLADLGSSGHADTALPEPVTTECPFAPSAGDDSNKSFSLQVFGFSQVQASDLGAESSARQIRTCNYLMEPGKSFSLPEVVNTFRFIRDHQQKSLGIQCGGKAGIQKSDTMADLCRRWIVSLQAKCAETWSDIVPDTCKETTPPFGITEKSTVHEMCPVDCAKPGELDVTALAGKIKERVKAQRLAEEKARREARERMRRQAQEEERKKAESEANKNEEAKAAKQAKLNKIFPEADPELSESLANNPELADALAKARAECPDCTLAELLARNPALGAALGAAPGLAPAPAQAPGVATQGAAPANAPASIKAAAAPPVLSKALAGNPGLSKALAAAIAANPGKSLAEILAANPELAGNLEAAAASQVGAMAPAPAVVMPAAPADSIAASPFAAPLLPFASPLLPGAAPLPLAGSPVPAAAFQNEEISDLKSEVRELKQSIRELRGELQSVSNSPAQALMRPAASPAFASQFPYNPALMWPAPGARALSTAPAAAATTAGSIPTAQQSVIQPESASATAAPIVPAAAVVPTTGRLGPAMETPSASAAAPAYVVASAPAAPIAQSPTA